MSLQLQPASFIQKQNGIQRIPQYTVWKCVFLLRMFDENENIINFGYWDPFLERTGNFSGPKSNIQIEI